MIQVGKRTNPSSEHLVYFNGELEKSSRKKIRIGDTIEIPDLQIQIHVII